MRIHGVGGNPEDALLGLTKGAVTIRVAGDKQAGFYARPDDPHVQAYVWWKLTTGAAVQGLWILLLPFTLFNVANWMFPREVAGVGRSSARTMTRFVMFLIGLSLTLSYLLWEFAIVVQLVFYRWRFDGGLDGTPPGWVRAILPGWLERASGVRDVSFGLLGVVLTGVLIFLVSWKTRGDFERFPGPEQLANASPEPPTPLMGVPIRDASQEKLEDPSFWHRPKASVRSLLFHLGAGGAMFGGLAVWSVLRARSGQALDLRPWFFWLTAAQLVLLVAGFVLYLVGWPVATHFRWAPPVMVAAASISLTTGFFTGVTFWIAKHVGLGSSYGLDLDLSAAYGLGSVVFVVSLLVSLWLRFHGRLRELDDMVAKRDVPVNTQPPGAEPNGVDPGMLRSVALLRSLSRSLEHFDALITPGSVAFILGGLFLLAPKTHVPSPLGWLTNFGRWELLTLVGIALPALTYRSFKPSERAKVKTLWDATTFWPRRFHPLAIRPYAERSVPEIQGRVVDLVDRHHARVVVAAHSQGAVLAYCALVHLSRWRPELTEQVALVTFGCPLQHMHARYFPAYFVDHDPSGARVSFETLGRRLFPEVNPATRARNRSTAWTNFYHRTDYVGQCTFVNTDRAAFDFELPDPAKRPPYRRRSVWTSWAVAADPPLPTFTRTLVHSYYNNSVELRAWVRIVERRLGR